MAVKSAQKKKTQPVIRRRSSITAEEKHIGIETTNWSQVKDMNAAIYDNLRHYNYFYELKEAVKWVTAWMKKNMSKEDLRAYQEAEPWRTSMTAASFCRMHDNGAPFDSARIEWIKAKLQIAINAGHENLLKKQKTEEVTTTITAVTPADIIKRKASDFISEVEAVLDDWMRGILLDISSYSVYNELKKLDAPSNVAKAVIEYYTPLKNELTELLGKKSKDLLEGYKHLSLKERKEYLTLVTSIVDNAEQYLNSKKAVRKSRTVKPKSAGQQIAKLKYLKESPEFRLTSVDPVNIVGAQEVWLFNVKYHTLIRAVSDVATGFTLKGTTLKGINVTLTDKKRLRKPDETLKEVMGSTKAKLNRMYSDIKAKPSAYTGRLNEDTIILRTFK